MGLWGPCETDTCGLTRPLPGTKSGIPPYWQVYPKHASRAGQERTPQEMAPFPPFLLCLPPHTAQRSLGPSAGQLGDALGGSFVGARTEASKVTEAQRSRLMGHHAAWRVGTDFLFFSLFSPFPEPRWVDNGLAPTLFSLGRADREKPGAGRCSGSQKLSASVPAPRCPAPRHRAWWNLLSRCCKARRFMLDLPAAWAGGSR